MLPKAGDVGDLGHSLKPGVKLGKPAYHATTTKEELQRMKDTGEWKILIPEGPPTCMGRCYFTAYVMKFSAYDIEIFCSDDQEQV